LLYLPLPFHLLNCKTIPKREAAYDRANNDQWERTKKQGNGDSAANYSMVHSRFAAFHVYHGSVPKIRRMTTTQAKKEGVDMNSFATMSPIFGVFFALAGLALAVILGLVLYPNKKQKTASSKQSLRVHEEGKNA
jgi:hypothetical protein